MNSHKKSQNESPEESLKKSRQESSKDNLKTREKPLKAFGISEGRLNEVPERFPGENPEKIDDVIFRVINERIPGEIPYETLG